MSITPYTNNILNANYGDDVRDSIVNALNECYKDATGNNNSIASLVQQYMDRDDAVGAVVSALTGLYGEVGEYIVTDTTTSSVSMATSTYANFGSLTLSPGVWLVVYGGEFSVNGTGYRWINLTPDSSSPASGTRWTSSIDGNSSRTVNIIKSRPMMVNETTTYYLFGWQNSGSTLTGYPILCAIKIKGEELEEGNPLYNQLVSNSQAIQTLQTKQSTDSATIRTLQNRHLTDIRNMEEDLAGNVSILSSRIADLENADRVITGDVDGMQEIINQINNREMIVDENGYLQIQNSSEYVTPEEQDEIEGLTNNERALILTLLSKAAYAEDDARDAYDQLSALWAVYSVTWSGTGYTHNNTSVSARGGSTFVSTVTASGGHTISTVVATMGGVTVQGAWSNGTVTIPNVTGDIVITVTTVQGTIASIDATYTQSGIVLDSDSLDSLKSDLVVTATYVDQSTFIIPSSDYTLSGTLEVGTSTITVSYGTHTDTFDVTVSSEEWTVVRTIGDNYVPGRVLTDTDGIDETQTSWYTSGFLAVPDGATSYSRVTSRTTDWYLVWYDSEQSYIGNGESGTYSGNGTYGGGYTDGNGVLWNVVPSTAKYCRVSWRTSATYTSVTFAHNKVLDENTIPVANKLYAYTYDPTATGNSFNNDDFLKCSGMIYAQIRPVQQRSITFYDEDFLVVSTITRATNIGNNASIPSNAVYLKCQCTNAIATANNATTRIGTGLIMFTDETKSSW